MKSGERDGWFIRSITRLGIRGALALRFSHFAGRTSR